MKSIVKAALCHVGGVVGEAPQSLRPRMERPLRPCASWLPHAPMSAPLPALLSWPPCPAASSSACHSLGSRICAMQAGHLAALVHRLQSSSPEEMCICTETCVMHVLRSLRTSLRSSHASYLLWLRVCSELVLLQGLQNCRYTLGTLVVACQIMPSRGSHRVCKLSSCHICLCPYMARKSSS